MEPQDNKPLVLQKAISAHEQAEACIADLGRVVSPDRCEVMVARIRDNLAELHAEAAAAAAAPDRAP